MYAPAGVDVEAVDNLSVHTATGNISRFEKGNFYPLVTLRCTLRPIRLLHFR